MTPRPRAKDGGRSGNRAPSFSAAYRAAALVLLNAVLLLVAVEIVMSVALSVARTTTVRGWIAATLDRPNDIVAHYLSLPYYKHVDWAEQYWSEHRAALGKEYRPYVVWRSPPFAGRTLNVDRNGRRFTPGAECGPDAFRIFVFGGSAMWGWGAPDWGTIPARMQGDLAASSGDDVCLVNLAENAFVSTQSLIQLVLELQAGERPDLVLFYDGVNDVLSASQSGTPAAHQNLTEITGLFEAPRPTLLDRLGELNTVRVVRLLATHLGAGESETPRSDVNALAEAIAATYLHNYRIADSIARTYGFELHFFWQPHILTGAKDLTADEQELIDGLSWVLELDPALVQLFEATYERVRSEASGIENLHDLSGVFDGTDSQVWIDTWGHVTPDGNERVAAAILDVVFQGSRRSKTSKPGSSS